MKIFSIKNFSLYSIFFILLFISGCLPYHTTEKAAVVVLNKTDTPIQYKLFLSGKWSQEATIGPGASDYAFQYEDEPGNNAIPTQLTRIKLSTIKCKVLLRRGDIEKFFIRDPEGRTTWNLYFDGVFLRKMGCK